MLASNTADIYRNTGEFLENFPGSASRWCARVFGAVQPLHYGTFGGFPIKLFYFVMALALTYITSTGMMIWFKRKAQQGQPRLKPEATWRGMTTGLTLSLSLCALLATIGGELPLAAIGLATWAVALVAIRFAARPGTAVLGGWLASAGLLLAALAINATAAIGGETTSWLVNTILALIATGPAAAAARLRSRRVSNAPPVAANPVPAE